MSKTAQLKNKKICYVLAYKSPDYVRTRVLLRALSGMPGVTLYTAINSSPSAFRYLQTLWRVLKVRFRHHPDAYLLGFRGHEIYWPLRVITFPRPVIFDEFINVQDWLTVENKVIKANSWAAKLAHWLVRSMLRSAAVILTDTQLDAASSSQTYGIPADKYKVIYVGTDEELFKPARTARPKNDNLEVFFYGTMAPLHGLKYILEAAELLKQEAIHFTIVGGKGKPQEVAFIQGFIKDQGLQNVTHHEWIAFEQLPAIIAKADICLAGPFGNTSQSQRVITGKAFQFLAMAKPIIIGQTAEQTGLKDKANCLIANQGSAVAIAEALKWAVANKNQLPKIGQAGRQLYDREFSTEHAKQQLKTIINEL